MMVLVIRHVALEGYKYIRRSGNIVSVFMWKVDIDSWPSYYFNRSYYIYIYIYIYYIYIYIYNERAKFLHYKSTRVSQPRTSTLN